jgi:hypothetical protein
VSVPRSWMIAIPLAWQVLTASACAGGRAVLPSGHGAFDVATVHASNERYFLRGTGCGRTPVYEVGRREPLYVVGDPMDQSWGRAFLSTDGRVIVYVNTWQSSEGISIYRDGRLVSRLASSEVTRCDERRERCQLVYSNSDRVIDNERSGWTAGGYHKVFKAGVSEQERFLNESPLFSSGDAVYLIDARKRVHRFSLEDGTAAEPVAFENVYPGIKQLPRETRTESKMYDAPEYSASSLVVAGGKRADEALARRLHLKVMALPVDPQFKEHLFFVSGALQRDGRFEVDELAVYGNLKREELTDFFSTSRFDTRLIPAPCDWWYLENQVFNFRNPDKGVARREQKAYLIEQQKERQERLAAERIKDVYIPKDLGECFVELDRMLAEVSRNEMKALSKREEMARHHMDLGMALRNNWGLWGGSRLQKYFRDRGVREPDEMSGIILDYYYDWLHGDRDGWKNWEVEWRARIPQPPPPAPAPPKKVR